jgi:XTP/dITP diphosphohydrolase
MGSDASVTVVVATNNPHKVDEIRSALGSSYRFVAAGQLDPDWPSPVEDGDTFEENARIKALAAHERFKTAVLADDSGLEVDALGGLPGVHSRYYAGPDATDRQNNERLLRELENTPPAERSARFRSTLVFVDADGRIAVATGTCEGRIGTEARGENGFGYDPLFQPDATPGLSMAELSMGEKNAISHRGAALRALSELLTDG